MIIEDLVSNLELQLSELDLLQSMYPSEKEFHLDDPFSMEIIRNWMNKPEAEDIPSMISFAMRLPLEKEEEEKNAVIDVHVQLVKSYPSESLPEIHMKSASIDREMQSQMNSQLKEYLSSQWEPQSLVIGLVVSWIQENGANFVTTSHGQASTSTVDAAQTREDCQSNTRLWIYSHHIYSKIKRKNILDLADDFKLTGFSMPGKPGIICLEGRSRDVNEAWSAIKSWNWKKINVKIQEDFHDKEDSRFDGFEEIGFVKNSDSRDYHMDMGQFFDYLKERKSEYMFKELFGINKVD